VTARREPGTAPAPDLICAYHTEDQIVVALVEEGSEAVALILREEDGDIGIENSETCRAVGYRVRP